MKRELTKAEIELAGYVLLQSLIGVGILITSGICYFIFN